MTCQLLRKTARLIMRLVLLLCLAFVFGCGRQVCCRCFCEEPDGCSIGAKQDGLGSDGCEKICREYCKERDCAFSVAIKVGDERCPFFAF